jgi:hypothetical protein
MMNWDELGRLAADYYVTIGAHSVGHHVFSCLSEEELEGELIDAKAELEARLGKPSSISPILSVDGTRLGGANSSSLASATTSRRSQLETETSSSNTPGICKPCLALGIDGNQPPLSALSRMESGLRTGPWKRMAPARRGLRCSPSCRPPHCRVTHAYG